MTLCVQGKSKEGPEKILSLYLRLILSAQRQPITVPPPKKQTNNSNNKKQILGKGENLISKGTMFLDSNCQYSTTTTKITSHRKKTEKYCLFQREN